MSTTPAPAVPAPGLTEMHEWLIAAQTGQPLGCSCDWTFDGESGTAPFDQWATHAIESLREALHLANKLCAAQLPAPIEDDALAREIVRARGFVAAIPASSRAAVDRASELSFARAVLQLARERDEARAEADSNAAVSATFHTEIAALRARAEQAERLLDFAVEMAAGLPRAAASPTPTPETET